MKNILAKLARPDSEYKARLESYTWGDTVIALVYYAALMITYYVIGRMMAQTGKYYGEQVNLVIMIIPIILCIRKLSRTGISMRNLGKSLITGTVLGVIWLLWFSVVPGMLAGAAVLPVKAIIYNVYYFFFIIAFSEEISFRGYIQPRLFPLLKREWAVYLIGGVMFVLMHYPFQMASRGMSFTEYWPMFIAGAPMQLLLHYAFTWLYRRYDNIFGSTVMHGLIDMTMGIFE